MRQWTNHIVLFLLLFNGIICYGITSTAITGGIPTTVAFQDSLDWADYYFNTHEFEKAIPLYEQNLDIPDKGQKIHVIKKLALSQAALNDSENALSNIYNYFEIDFHPTFLLHEGFDGIRDSSEFSKLSGTVIPKITGWSVFYFFVSLVGFYIALFLLISKKIDKEARVLISIFIFIHSLFILNICVNQTNYVFQYPHTYLMSTWSSFMYGPLLFLYFRRVSRLKNFSPKDLLHFIPTLILIVYMFFTVYAYTGSEKIQQMLDRLQEGLNPGDSTKLVLMVILKALSLAIYAYLVHRIISKTSEELPKKTHIWQKNMYIIHVSYVAVYIIYGLYIMAGKNSGVMFHTPIILMSVMVLYVGYAANVQPDIFSGLYAYTNRLFPKYVKSGLTNSLSFELKQKLIDLFENEKLYRHNEINLDMVAEKLDTTRHNASQLINEHFSMSFHQFVNSYRIEEAQALLQEENERNIIDIAYEVGYNNKVSFNKAFKKNTDLTPSQYLNYIKDR